LKRVEIVPEVAGAFEQVQCFISIGWGRLFKGFKFMRWMLIDQSWKYLFSFAPRCPAFPVFPIIRLLR